MSKNSKRSLMEGKSIDFESGTSLDNPPTSVDRNLNFASPPEEAQEILSSREMIGKYYSY